MGCIYNPPLLPPRTEDVDYDACSHVEVQLCRGLTWEEQASSWIALVLLCPPSVMLIGIPLRLFPNSKIRTVIPSALGLWGDYMEEKQLKAQTRTQHIPCVE